MCVVPTIKSPPCPSKNGSIVHRIQRAARAASAATWLKASERLSCGDRSLASNTRHQPTSHARKKVERHTHPIPRSPRSWRDQPFPSLGLGEFPENLKRTLVTRTLASDPKAIRWALIKRILIRKMNPEIWAGTNHWRPTGVTDQVGNRQSKGLRNI